MVNLSDTIKQLHPTAHLNPVDTPFNIKTIFKQVINVKMPLTAFILSSWLFYVIKHIFQKYKKKTPHTHTQIEQNKNKENNQNMSKISQYFIP